jgi:flagellar hook protein FlgE
MGIGHSGLSGVRASTFELSTIGNNVANAGTVGFKKSTAEFSDVMSGTVGGGVEISDLRQTFSQGSIQGTGNTWDLAISGRGFFKVSEGSDDPNVAVKDNFYTRNGAFGVDASGYVVNSSGMRLHMFEAKGTGDNIEFPVSTNTTEILIQQNDSEAKATEGMSGMFNLDARVSSRGVATSTPTSVASTVTELPVGAEFLLNNVRVTATGHAEMVGSTASSLDGTETIKINDVVIGPAASLTSFKDAINLVENGDNGTGVHAEISGLGQLKLTSSTKDIKLEEGAAGNLATLGLTAGITPAVTLASLVNDINASGTGVSGSIKSVMLTNSDGEMLNESGVVVTNEAEAATIEAVQLSGAVDIKVETSGTGAAVNNILEFAGISVGSYEVSYNGMVNPMDDVSYDHSVTNIIYDTLGSKQTVNTFFQKVTDGQWEVYSQRVDSLGNTYPIDETKSLKVGEVHFDGSGALSKIVSGQSGSEVVYDTTVIPNVTTNTKLTMETGSPAVGKDGYIELDIGGTNQFAGKFRIVDLSQDGYSSGALTGVEVDESGTIRASYTNGNTLQLGKVALFEFNNSQGLRQEGGVLWAATNDSGDPRPGEPGESVFGRIKSLSLESSAVDVTEELVNLITAQRNFQANSKMISASKEMNQVVLNI